MASLPTLARESSSSCWSDVRIEPVRDTLWIMQVHPKEEALLLRRFLQSPLTDSNRRPLLTIKVPRQLVATGGNGFGLVLPFPGSSDLLPVATGCDR